MSPKCRHKKAKQGVFSNSKHFDQNRELGSDHDLWYRRKTSYRLSTESSDFDIRETDCVVQQEGRSESWPTILKEKKLVKFRQFVV